MYLAVIVNSGICGQLILPSDIQVLPVSITIGV